MFDLKNNIDFFLRNKIRISRKNYIEVNETKEYLEFTDDEKNLEVELLKKYDFAWYKNNSTIPNYCQNLYTLYFLDKYLNVKFNKNLSVLDIGSKNWFYVAGEYFFFKSYCNNLNLDGVELDAYRLYSNFYNRYEVAKFYTKDLIGTTYIADDLLNIKKSYDYIIWILPFVTKYPLKVWGLPNRFFCPQKLFDHAFSILKPSGKMIIINQGMEEFEEQQKISKDMVIFSSLLESPFYKYKNERYITVVEK